MKDLMINGFENFKKLLKLTQLVQTNTLDLIIWARKSYGPFKFNSEGICTKCPKKNNSNRFNILN